MAQKKPKEVGIAHLPTEDDIMSVSTGNYQEKFLYGKSIEAIDYNTGIKNKPTAGGQLFAGSVTYTTTGVKTVSGVGFTPVMVEIMAHNAAGNSQSNGYGYGTSESCIYTIYGGTTTVGSIGYSAYLENGGNPTITTDIVMNSDGFTINVNNVTGGAITILYKCYG